MKVIAMDSVPADLDEAELKEWFKSGDHLVDRTILTKDTATPLEMEDGEFMYYQDFLYEKDNDEYVVFINNNLISGQAELTIQKWEQSEGELLFSASGSTNSAVTLTDMAGNLTVYCDPIQ